MGHFGFSYIGVLYLVMLFAPNAVWAKNKPIDAQPITEHKVLLFFERIGQVFCTSIVLVFRDFNLAPFSQKSIWFLVSFFLMLVYELCWIRYFIGPHTEQAFYKSFCGVPVPLAVLPVFAFFLLGVYGEVIWLSIAAVFLGIGHIGIHIQHIKAMKKS